MTIFTPVLSEEDFKLSLKNYQEIIKQHQGEIVDSTIWGLKSLAYPINKKTTGIYWVLEFIADPKFIETLKIRILRDENIMRHVISKLDKNGVEYNHVIRNGGFPKQHSKIKEEA